MAIKTTVRMGGAVGSTTKDYTSAYGAIVAFGHSLVGGKGV